MVKKSDVLSGILVIVIAIEIVAGALFHLGEWGVVVVGITAIGLEITHLFNYPFSFSIAAGIPILATIMATLVACII